MAHVIGLAFSFSQSLIYIVYGVSFYFGAWLIEHRGLQFVDVFKYVYYSTWNDSADFRII